MSELFINTHWNRKLLKLIQDHLEGLLSTNDELERWLSHSSYLAWNLTSDFKIVTESMKLSVRIQMRLIEKALFKKFDFRLRQRTFASLAYHREIVLCSHSSFFIWRDRNKWGQFLFYFGLGWLNWWQGLLSYDLTANQVERSRVRSLLPTVLFIAKKTSVGCQQPGPD